MHTNRTFNAYISRYNISDYRTKYSGRPFHIVKKEAMNFMRGAILVGHSIHHDLRGLGIEVLQDDANNGRTPSLAFLSERFLRKKIRQNGQHSCMEDARTTLQLYGLVAKRWEADLNEELYDDFYDNCFNTYYDDVLHPWENDDYDDYDYDYLYFY
ncbi:hypothetical protein ABMA28_017334 [Loxostege sticticalis]|uniref:RNA exonuclease 4 n=1 Tax=Loxostege sticticalis TaxID=481309 RepID=A0ABD0S3Y5_LOXSC